MLVEVQPKRVNFFCVTSVLYYYKNKVYKIVEVNKIYALVPKKCIHFQCAIIALVYKMEKNIFISIGSNNSTCPFTLTFISKLRLPKVQSVKSAKQQ